MKSMWIVYEVKMVLCYGLWSELWFWMMKVFVGWNSCEYFVQGGGEVCGSESGE